jgi:hypothetical protein
MNRPEEVILTCLIRVEKERIEKSVGCGNAFHVGVGI